MIDTEVAIIGAGPAGVAAALQLNRYAIHTVILEKDKVGGLLKNAQKIENYPGFPKGLSGHQLAQRLEEHLIQNQINLHLKEVRNLEFLTAESKFLISCFDWQCKADFVVVASGTKPCPLEIKTRIPDFLRKRIFYEVYPLLKEKGKEILIVGAGDAAYDYALSLVSNNKIIIVNRSDSIKALPLLRNRVRKNAGIQYFDFCQIQAITEGKSRRLSASFILKGKSKIFEVDYILCAIGRFPQKDFYSPGIISQAEQLKKIGLLHEIGDLVKGRYRQVAIAAGNGVQAAMTIYDIKFNKRHMK
jgi:thioredoxin reductase